MKWYLILGCSAGSFLVYLFGGAVAVDYNLVLGGWIGLIAGILFGALLGYLLAEHNLKSKAH